MPQVTKPQVREPKLLQRRPHWRGMPIPMVVTIDAKGIPDFAVIDRELTRELAFARKCGLCGFPMKKTVAFIGGPKSLDAGTFIDGPSHPKCARYAAFICPFISGDQTYRSDDVSNARHGEKNIDTIGIVSTASRGRIGMIIVQSFSYTDGVFQAADIVGQEWFNEDE